MKLLYILNVANRVNNFSHAAMLAAQELGIEFYIAGRFGYASAAEREADAAEKGIHIVQLDLDRSPFSLQNRVAYRQLCELIRREKIDAIHCNTPVGGMLGRLAGEACGVQTVIYQVHGFHFYKGAPLLNWCTYYPVEKWLARKTDALVTINHEDFELATRRMKLRRGGKVYYVPGVGIDTARYGADAQARLQKRAELGLSDADVALISMGDLIERKNYETAIRAIAAAQDSRLRYLICGAGAEEARLRALADRLGVSAQVRFLGYRSDIRDLLAASDIFLLTSKQEGLPRALMEAMASGLPCVASRIRGNVDLLTGDLSELLCVATDADDFASKIKALAADPALRVSTGSACLASACRFEIDGVKEEIRAICDEEIGKRGGAELDRYLASLAAYFPPRLRKRMQLGISPHAFVLIMVGELNANKNIGVVLRAMEKTASADIHCLLCGVGDHMDALRQQAEHAGLRDRVHFLGYRTDMRELYAASDCLVMSSLREGLPRSVMEAMASGLPCVVSRIRGNVDLIADGENGFTSAANDADGFAAAIDTLAGDPALCRTLGENNRKKAAALDTAEIRDRWVRLYGSLLFGEEERQDEDIAFIAK